MSDSARKARAEVRRRTATLHKARLAAVEHDANKIEGEAAVSLVAALTRESWSESRQPFPEYSRSQIPIRFVPIRST
jgi:hypothetical protein